MKVVVVGGSGLLGSVFGQVLSAEGALSASFTSKTLDITDPVSVQKQLSAQLPFDVLINCAAKAHVDQCETDQEQALAVNAIGVGLLANFCEKYGQTMVHFSTDYVFDGQKEGPYTELDRPNPQNYYGLTKWQGEQAVRALDRHYLFRIQWLYGPFGRHFVDTVLSMAQSGRPMTMVHDQWGSPTYTQEIVKGVLAALKHAVPFGTYHLVNQGYATWYQFTQEIFRVANLHVELEPILTSMLNRPAKRPLNGCLDTQKFCNLGVFQPLGWQAAFSDYFPNRQKSSTITAQ